MLQLKEKIFQKRLIHFNPEAMPSSGAEKIESKKDSTKLSLNEKTQSPYEKAKEFTAKLETSDVAPVLKEVMDGYILNHLDEVSAEAYADKIKMINQSGGKNAVTFRVLLEHMQDIYFTANPGARGNLDETTGLPKGMFEDLFQWAQREVNPRYKAAIPKISDRVKAIVEGK